MRIASHDRDRLNEASRDSWHTSQSLRARRSVQTDKIRTGFKREDILGEALRTQPNLHVHAGLPQWRPEEVMTDRQRHRLTDRQTNTQTDKQTDRQTNRHIDRQTDTQRDRKTDRQTHRQTDRQTERHRQTDTQR
jgi:hypothetical protein